MEENLNSQKSSHFMMTVRKLLSEHHKTLIYTVAGYMGVSIALGLFLGYLGGDPSLVGSFPYIFLAGVVCAYAASKMMSELTTKEGRISLLMSPDSAASKFIVRLIAVLPGMLLLVAVGYFAYLCSALLANGISNGVWHPISNPFRGVEYWSVVSLSAVFLFNEAVFIFGSTAWPRKSFIKTVGILSLLQIVLMFIMVGFVKLFYRLGWSIQVVDPVAFVWCVFAVLTAISIAIIYASYYKFKRIQVV